MAKKGNVVRTRVATHLKGVGILFYFFKKEVVSDGMSFLGNAFSLHYRKGAVSEGSPTPHEEDYCDNAMSSHALLKDL